MGSSDSEKRSTDRVTPLRPHPRLVLTNERLVELRHEIQADRVGQGMFEELQARAEFYLCQPPPEHRVEGRRLLAVSRRVVAHVLTFAVLARLTGDARYVRAATDEMLAASAFPDWNPSHFLDAAEMATALSLGYDWLYELLSPQDRATIERALVEKALEPMCSQDWFWFTAQNNWNSVCHAGCTLAALVIAEIEPALSQKALGLVRRNIGHVAASYGPDGAYDEGPMYWDYGTTFLALLCSAVETATGESFEPNVPGLFASADYMTHVVASSGNFYNYSDCRLERSPTPTLFWFARQLNRPAVASFDQTRFRERTAAAPVTRPAHEGERLMALGLIWQRPSSAGRPQTPSTVWVGQGRTPVALMRTGWTADAAFLGIKGGSPMASHGHMDVGSFVYENAGVRWALDLPLQEYHALEAAGLNLWDNHQTSDRWSVFRLGAEGHGILRFDDGQQNVDGVAPLKVLSDAGAIGRVEIDLSPLYPALTSVTRTAALEADGSLNVIDRWQTQDRSTRVSWQLLTPAAAEVTANGFVLEHSGKRLRVEFESADGQLVFTATPADALTRPYDAANSGVSRLVASFESPANAAGEIRARFTRIESNESSSL